MITKLKQIKCIVEDVRLNSNNTPEIVEYKLRVIEDICTKSIMALNEIRNQNN